MEKKKQQLSFSLKQDNTYTDKFLKLVKTILPAVGFALFAQPNYCAVNNQEIIRQLQQKIISNPKDTEAHLKLAIEYSVANDFVKAVETYFALLRLDPNNFHAYNNLGILYKQSGQFRDSLHCYQQAQRIDPDSCWVPYNMGLCYEAMGRMQEARESYGQALSLNPSFSQALQRLRILSSDGTDQIVPELPALVESQIYLADSKVSKPVIKSQPTEKPKITKPQIEKLSKIVEKVDKIDKIEKVSERLEKEKKQKKDPDLKHRTSKKGPAAIVFNQAMDALESDTEPENGLIRKGLIFLKDRPNRMNNGLFFRGMFIFISGYQELAIPDFKSYVEVNSKNGKSSSVSQYVAEAKRIIQKHEDELKAIAAMEAEKAAALAEQKKKIEAVTAAAEQEIARPSDFALKRMDVDQIIQEADKLSRESRLTDAVAVLEAGLSKDANNIQLLMKSANAYTDMLLLKGDNEAGKMAILRYRKILSYAQPNSKEAAIAKEMLDELNKRVR